MSFLAYLGLLVLGCPEVVFVEFFLSLLSVMASHSSFSSRVRTNPRARVHVSKLVSAPGTQISIAFDAGVSFGSRCVYNS